MMLNVAMLSGWHVHADEYAREFAAIPGVKLTAMWDDDETRGKAFAEKYGMEFVPCLDTLLKRADVDAVCVTTSTNRHIDVIVKAAKAGKHIFTEKVLGITNAEAKTIADAVRTAGVKFCISFPHRTHPHNLFAKQVLDEKLLGKVTLMRVRNAHSGASAGWLPPHFYDEAQCGGGAMMDLGAHPMYLIRWLMGRPTEMSSAFTAVTGHAVEDNAVSIMKFSCGAVAISETGFVSSAAPFELELYGTDGSLLICGKSVQLYCKDSAGAQPKGWVSVEHLPKPGKNAIRQFVDGIVKGEAIEFGIDDAVALTEMMDAAYRSHREGKTVTV